MSQTTRTTSLRSARLNRWLAAAVLGATIILWSSAFAGIRVALVSYQPVQMAFLRYLIASLVLAAYALLSRMPMPALRDLPGIALAGVVGFTIYNIAVNVGEQTVSAGAASFIVSAEVAVIALLATIFQGERLGQQGWLGVTACIVGVGIISINPEEGFNITTGALIVFIATLAISVYTVMQKPFLERYNAIQFTAYAVWAGTLALLPFAAGAFRSITHAAPQANTALLFLGIFPGVLAYLGWSYVLTKIPTARAGSYLALVPISANIIAWFWLGEVPGAAALVGGAIVLAGVVLVNRRGS